VNVEKAILFHENHRPECLLFTDTVLIPDIPVDIDLLQYFTDTDGDPLSFACTLTSDHLATVGLKGSILTIQPQFHGNVVLQVSAFDPYSEVQAAVNITIEQKYASKDADELLIYPNPTSDELFYSFITKEAATVFARIYDISGQMMYESTHETLNPGNHYYHLDISSWDIGVYILQYFQNGKKADAKKFIKR
jgi:hypothetical protein